MKASAHHKKKHKNAVKKKMNTLFSSSRRRLGLRARGIYYLSSSSSSFSSQSLLPCSLDHFNIINTELSNNLFRSRGRRRSIFTATSSNNNTNNDIDIDNSVKKKSSSSSSSSYEFIAETSRLLDIVTNSLYQEKEVFLRELISNASDALEKRRHEAQKDAKTFGLQGNNEEGTQDSEFAIRIRTIEENKTLKLIIEDNGIGMSKEELIRNLGTIARSGSKEFLENLNKNEKTSSSTTTTTTAGNIIGKFGVGFYSAFMVGSKVEVHTSNGNESSVWESEGIGKFTVSPSNEAPTPRGSKIIIHIKDDCKTIASQWAIEETLKKYSAFVSFPIYINDSKYNEIGALWMKKQGDVSDEQATAFYRYVSGATDSPTFRMHFEADAPLTIRSLIFFPETNPERGIGMHAKVDSGISLYSRRIMIQKNAHGLLPPFLRFLRGVVDCEDIPLNISRETLQDSQVLRKLGEVVTKKALKHLKDVAKKDPEAYDRWFKELGFFLKEGACTEPQLTEQIAELLRFESSATSTQKNDADETTNEDNPSSSSSSFRNITSFEKYIERMKPDQKHIYYLVAPSRAQAESSPYLEACKAKGYEVLYLYAHVDEFVMQHLGNVKGKFIVSVEAENPDISLEKNDDDDDKVSAKSKENMSDEESKELLKWFSDVLAFQLKEVTKSNRLVTSPALLSGHEPEAMRRYRAMASMASDSATNARLTALNDKITTSLEINCKHPLLLSINAARKSEDPNVQKVAKDVAFQIYDNARVAAGTIDDPREMLGRLNEILKYAIDSVSAK
jgi:TNF receptor-associated protein 1